MPGGRLRSSWASPEDSRLQAVAPLLKYLDEKLALLNDSLVKENLSRYQLGSGAGGGACRPRESPQGVPLGCWRLSGSCCFRPFCRH